MQVKVMLTGGSVQNVEFDSGQSVVKDALLTINQNPDGLTIRVNGAEATAETPVSDGDIITATPKVEGGGLK